MYRKLYFPLLLILLSTSLIAQVRIPDTLLVQTRRNPVFHQSIYVLNGEREMIVNHGDTKNDTVYIPYLEEDVRVYYNMSVRTLEIRAKKLKDLDADEVFDYFPMGISVEETLRKLEGKKVAIYDSKLEVEFFNRFAKTNEVFTFRFNDGKLCEVSRPGTSHLPTNNLSDAFFLVQLKSNVSRWQEAIERLKK